nr:MAG TPA: hypothetical protein [Crassvirales sp.]
MLISNKHFLFILKYNNNTIIVEDDSNINISLY